MDCYKALFLPAILFAVAAGCGGSAGMLPITAGGSIQIAYYVATNGSDSNSGSLSHPFRTIQHALNIARVPGDVVVVRRGTYFEAVTFPADGTAQRPIVLQNYPGERPFISGAKGASQRLVRIFDRSHVRFEGFEIGDLSTTSPLQSGAIFVEGYGDDVQVTNNFVHDVRPAPNQYANGRAIQVRGFYTSHPLTNVVVAGNKVDACTVQDGNVVEISGNTLHDRVMGNRLRDNRGIALNVTGGTKPPAYTRWNLQVRDVLVEGNTIDATYGSGAIGLYVQAARAVEVRRNHVVQSMWGIYVTSEYPGVHSGGVTIERNVVTHNAEAGILVGSPFFPTAVLGATVTNNTVVANGSYESGNGGNFGIGRARDVTVQDNQFVASDDQPLTYLGAPYTRVTLNHNCYDDVDHNSRTARFAYAGRSYIGFRRYQAATAQDRNSSFGDCSAAR